MPIDFKSIKSLFVTEDPNAPKGPEPEIALPNQSKTAPAQSAPSQPGEANPKFVEVLLKAMEGANLPGVDYLEYRQSVKSLEKMPMDEQVRYQSAFAMAQAMGATAPKLVESAGHYLNVLKTEQSKFDEALRNQTSERIGNRQEMIKNLDATLKQKAEQIKKLTQEMEAHRAEMEKLDLEIKEATSKVEGTKNDFLASYQALVSQINLDVENMKRFLK
jgi:hypothetical protein